VVFTIEFFIKIIGYGERFFKDSWNTFDMFILIVTILGVIMNSGSNASFGP